MLPKAVLLADAASPSSIGIVHELGADPNNQTHAVLGLKPFGQIGRKQKLRIRGNPAPNNVVQLSEPACKDWFAVLFFNELIQNSGGVGHTLGNVFHVLSDLLDVEANFFDALGDLFDLLVHPADALHHAVRFFGHLLDLVKGRVVDRLKQKNCW